MKSAAKFDAIALAVVAWFMLSRSKLRNVLQRQAVRSDAMGNGAFGAPRGYHVHEGLDLVAIPGEPVFSPVGGRFVRTGRPYADDDALSLVVLEGRGYLVKLMYVKPLPDLLPGEPVAAGQMIGTAQDVRERYGAKITPHVHVEFRPVVGGRPIDPAVLLRFG